MFVCLRTWHKQMQSKDESERLIAISPCKLSQVSLLLMAVPEHLKVMKWLPLPRAFQLRAIGQAPLM